ncbi:MAG: hypothetical protein ACLVL2_04000 [Bacteroides cellulosilyticus]
MTHCRYCYADTRTQVQNWLPTSRILELIREAAELPVQQINLIGGKSSCIRIGISFWRNW